MTVQDKYPCKRFSTFARIGGAGFKSLGWIDHYRSRALERNYVMFTRRLLPFDYWIGRGRPLNPYLKGVIIYFLRNEFKPRDLTIAPEQYFAAEAVADFNEWSVLRVWMKSWLKYCKWYFMQALSPEVTIEEFFNAPIVHQKWWCESTDPQLVRFGILWKVYDMVALKGLD